jgi:flagellar basal-body rod modification protein FlgD
MSITAATGSFNYATLNSGTTATSANTTQDAAATADRFLKLLVAQMKNQDPLNPMDNAQVTTQMAQINTVSGIEKLNSTVSGLNAQFDQLQSLQSAALVGRNVVVPGDKLAATGAWDSGERGGAFELASTADKVEVQILNANGSVVETQTLGKRNGGSYSFTSKAPDGATFRVVASNGETKVATTTLTSARVQAVSMGGAGGVRLELSNGSTVSYTDVRSLS